MFKENKTKTHVEFIGEKEIPRVFITTETIMKMECYIEQCDKEISWLGTVERNENDFIITDVMLLKQDVTSVTTEINEAALTTFGSTLIKEGKQDLFNKFKFWGHSHVNMGVSPSNQDEETFADFYKNSDYFIRMIGNKSGDMRVDLIDCNKNMKFTNLDWYEFKSSEQLDLESKLQEFLDKQQAKKETISKEIEKEIDVNIITEKQNVRYLNNKNHYYCYSDDDFGSFRYWDDDKKKWTDTYDDDDDGGEITIPTVRVTFENRSMMMDINKIFDDVTLKYLYRFMSCVDDLKEEVQDYIEFYDYVDEDWYDFYDAVYDYQMLFLDIWDESEDENDKRL